MGTKIVTVETEETRYYCDQCGKEFTWGVCASHYHQCNICDRYLCNKCSNHTRDDIWGETWSYCDSCYKISKPYYDKLDDLTGKCYKEKEQITKEMERKCKSALKLP